MNGELLVRGLPAALVLAAMGGLVLLVALGYARERRACGRGTGAVLTALRAAVVAALVLLSLDLALRTEEPGEHRPRLLILVDASASMAATDRARSEAQLQAEAVVLGWELAAGLDARQREELRGASRMELAWRLLAGAPAGEESGGGGLLGRLREDFRVEVAALGTRGAPAPAAGAESAAPATAGRGFPEPLGQATDLGRPVLEAVLAALPDLAAAVVVSDGGHNDGAPPEETLAAVREAGVPLFAIGVGAETPPADLRVASVDLHERVYEGDRVAVDVGLETAGLGARTVPLRLSRGGETLAEVSVDLPESNRHGSSVHVPLEFTAASGGRWKWTVSVPEQAEEAFAANNRREGWIEVVAGKVRVVHLEGTPRWSFRYLRNALERDASLDARHVLLSAQADRRLPAEFPRQRADLFSFDVVVIGDVDREVFTHENLTDLRDFVTLRGGGLVVAAGERAMPDDYAGTPLAEVLPVALLPREALAPLPDATAFSLVLTPAGERDRALRLDPNRERNLELWASAPPLTWYHQHARAHEGVEVLAVRSDAMRRSPASARAERDAGAPSDDHASSAAAALIARRGVGAGNVLYVGTDETWRWRWRVGDAYFDTLWSQLVRDAAAGRLPPGDGKVRLTSDRVRYEVPAPVRLRALVALPATLDASAADARVDAELEETRSGRRRRYRLRAVPGSGGLYRGEAPTGTDPDSLPPAEYRVRLIVPAIAGYAEREDRATAQFSVEAAPSREQTSVARNGALLASLAAQGAPGGLYVPLEQVDELVERLPRDAVPTRESRLLEQWDLGWGILLLLVALLVAEWLLRARADLV